MEEKELLRELENVKTKYKDKPVYTFEVNIPSMIDSVMYFIKDQSKQLQAYKDRENKVRKFLSTQNYSKFEREHFKEYYEGLYIIKNRIEEILNKEER